MSKLYFVAVLFFVIFPLNAAQGVLWGAEDIRVVKTQWFDIIYPPESEQSAAILAEKADVIYYEIAGLYGHEPQVRMPVVLAPNVEECNAYFSNGPYNRIVIYDTAVIDDLAVFSEDLLSLFRHELTHAYTYNLKNGFWKFIGNVFGDGAGPSILTVSSGLAEGATMTSEASSGEGRLNSDFAMHMVKQAKLEKKFPSYYDVQGAGTVFPYGSFYYFNGAFNQWLQKKYGYEKYAAWWYSLVNGNNFDAGAFKKVYGIKLKKAWKQFEYEYQVPAIDENPLRTGFVKDYFSGTGSFSSKNLSGALYQSLSVSDTGNVWIEKKQNGVFYNGKKILTQRNIDTAKISSNGRFIAITYYDTKSPSILRKVKLYDTETGKTISVGGSGYADATVICKGQKYFLVCMGFSSIRKWIDVKEIEISDNGQKVIVKGKQKIDMPLNTMPGYFTDLNTSQGGLAYIKKSGLDYSLIVTEVGKNHIQEYFLPYKKMIVRDLSYSASTGELLFSWTKPGTMPRLGKFNLNSEEFTLYENDISGGIFTPVSYLNGKILYTGQFYRSYRLLVLDESKLSVCYSGKTEEKDYYYALPDKKIETVRLLSNAEPYKSIDYPRGILIPLSDINIYQLDPLSEKPNESVMAPLGFTYQGSDPWGGLSYGLSAGVSLKTGLGGASVNFSGGTDTSLFKWNAKAEIDFYYMEGSFNQAYGEYAGTFILPVGFYSRFGLTESLRAGLVRQNNLSFLDSYTSLYFSNLHYSGPGPLERAGFTAGCEVSAGDYVYRIQNLPQKYMYTPLNISPYLNIYIPKLLPVDCRNGFVYNLPLELSGSMYTRWAFINANAHTVLFRHDVQKSFPGLTLLFLQNYYLSAGYSSSWVKTTDEKLKMNDFIYLSGNMHISLSSTDTLGLVLFTDVKFNYRELMEGRNPITITPGIKTIF